MGTFDRRTSRRRAAGLVISSLLLATGWAVAQPAQPPADPQPIDPQPIDPQPIDPQPIDPQPNRPIDPHAGSGSGTSMASPSTSPSRGPVTVDDLVVDASRLRFGILLFGDVSAFLQGPAKPYSNFAIGAVGMRLNANLGSHAEALGEIAFEGEVADVEQLVVTYRSGHGWLSMGRIHTEMGYWNTAYHHGFWLQPLVARPHAIRFEDDGGLAPVHWVGLHGGYEIPVADGHLVLIGGVGNGRGEIVDDVLTGGDKNQAKGLLFKLAYRRKGRHRIDLGATALLDRIPPASAEVRPARPDSSIGELITNVHAFYRGPRLTFHGELFVFLHDAGKTHVTTSAFAVAGSTLAGKLSGYGGFDLIALDEEDPFFVPDAAAPGLTDLTELIAGLRYDLDTWDALKLEGHADLDHKNQYSLTLNWSFGI